MTFCKNLLVLIPKNKFGIKTEGKRERRNMISYWGE